MKILFLSTGGASLAALAERLARACCRPGCEVSAAVWQGGDRVPPEVERVLGEIGLPGPVRPPAQGEDAPVPETHDLVVAVGPAAAAVKPLLPGYPYMVAWDVPDPSSESGHEPARPLDAWRRVRDRLRARMETLFAPGWLEALTEARRRERLLLDQVSDGVLVHDRGRRIVLFNRAAESVTGYGREEVLGRDCHAVFGGGLCDGKCVFPEGTQSSVPDVVRREVEITTRDGETRLLDTVLQPLSDADGQPVGVMLTFRDITRERGLARRLGEIESFAGIVGRDPKMLELFDLIRDLAQSNVPVLIQGESGTGKELVAAAIHREGPRAPRPFVAVNCGALPETLLESELFGHVKGAFTGALRDKKGRFELADGGTIFLDEIGDISPAMQVKLMRVLQEGTFERVGSEQTIRVDVRVISATHRDLMREMAAGRFREDLFYRLSVVPLWIPPLRERRGDIPLLAEHLLRRALQSAGREGVRLAPETLDVMLSYDWPGNVRELQNWIQFALIKCKGDVIRPEHLPPIRHAQTLGAPMVAPARRPKWTAEDLQRALAASGGNRQEAARRLGISRATFYRLLRRLSR